MDVVGYAVHGEREQLAPLAFARRDVGSADVAIEIEWSGVCHSDIHTARSEWGDVIFPCVPGHEIVGRVTAVGSDVTTFSVGQRVGVGVYVDSCRECEHCLSGMSNYCVKGMIGTYNNPERDGDSYTLGGYATGIVVDQGYVVNVPESSTQQVQHLCSARASPSTLRSKSGVLEQARKSASSVLEAWDTWE